MQPFIYDFISTYTDKAESVHIGWEEHAIKTTNIEIRKLEPILSRLEKKDILFEYLTILKRYFDQRIALNYSIHDISVITDFTVLSIKRYENLQHILTTDNQLTLLKSVGLKFAIS